MIIAHADGLALVVLEPGNIIRLKAGRAVKISLEKMKPQPSSIILAYTPDFDYVQEEFIKSKDRSLQRLSEIVEISMTHQEVVDRPYHPPLKLKINDKDHHA